MKPNYTNLSLGSSMGMQLKLEVERQLSEDLKFYGLIQDQYKFDWSDCCIEGHSTNYLDGTVDNFSGIAVYNANDESVADGWMEFIHEEGEFIVYWKYLDKYQDGQEIELKSNRGIPLHIFKQLPEQTKMKYKDQLLT